MGIWSIIGLSILFLILRVIYKVIFFPWLKIQQYGKYEGAKKVYDPKFGVFKIILDGLAQKKDSLGLFKEWGMQEDKKLRFIATSENFKPLLYLIDPELIKEHFNKYSHTRRNLEEQGMWIETIGKSFSTFEGPEFKKRKAIITKVMNFEFMRAFTPAMIQVAKKHYDQFEKERGLKDYHLHECFGRITSGYIEHLFFNQAESKTVNGEDISVVLKNIFIHLGYSLMDPKMTILGKKLTLGLGYHKELPKMLKDYKAVMNEMVENKRKEYIANGRKPRMDFTENLFRYLDDHPEEKCMTEQEIIDNCMHFHLAGADTMTYTISNILYLLHKNPQYYPKLVAEIKENYGDGSKATIEGIQSMDFLHAIMMESLRIMPLSGFNVGSVATEDHMIGDIKVEKGTQIRTDIITKHYMPSLYEDPEVFKPERFLEGKNGPKHPMGFMTFSQGLHSCIGRQHAMLGMKVMLCEFLSRYEYEMILPKELVMQLTFLYAPAEPFKANLTKRA